MEIETPDWLTSDFIRSALEGNESKHYGSIKIISMEIKRAVPKGNNYICDIFRVKVVYNTNYESLEELLNCKNQEISLIVKSPIYGGLNDKLFEFGIIQKEVLMYQEYLPKLKTVLKEDSYIVAKSFYSNIENVLVLEDLNFRGYKMVNRLDQLDYEHSVLALESLALFHAASVKILEENPEMATMIGEELFFNKHKRDANDYITTSQIDLVIIEMSNWPELDGYIDTIKRLRDSIWDLLVDCFYCYDDEFNVLNHGDLWVTNMLFKYDHINKPSKIKLIDLQVSRYTTPAIDLIYFFQGSVQEKVRVERYEDLIKTYLNSLNENLKKLNCKRQRLDEHKLRQALQRCEFYAFYTNITLVPVVLHDTNEVFEIKDMSEKHIKDDLANNPFRKYYQSKRYKEVFLKRLVNEMSKHKWYLNLNKNQITNNY